MPFVQIFFMFGMPFVLMAFGGITVLYVRHKFPKRELNFENSDLAAGKIFSEQFGKILNDRIIASLKAEIDRGLSDVAAGRVQDLDAAHIIERGKNS